MIILSKHKDYYDYYVGIFGRDDKRVYDRRNMITLESFIQSRFIENGVICLCFAICGKMYWIKVHEGKPYCDRSDLIKLDKLTHVKSKYDKSTRIERVDSFLKANGKPTKANQELRQPILIGRGGYYSGDPEWFDELPLLSSFDFHKVLTDRDVYTQVETFLGWLVDNPPIPNKQSNKEKILSHGFDLKKSFRHRK